MYSGMVWCVSPFVGFSSCKPSWSGCGMGGRCEGVVSSVSGLCLRKSVTGMFPRSRLMMGHRLPFKFCRRL
jgi:hypothetical protein